MNLEGCRLIWSSVSCKSESISIASTLIACNKWLKIWSRLGSNTHVCALVGRRFLVDCYIHVFSLRLLWVEFVLQISKALRSVCEIWWLRIVLLIAFESLWLDNHFHFPQVSIGWGVGLIQSMYRMNIVSWTVYGRPKCIVLISQLPNLFGGTPRICNCNLLLIVWVRSFSKRLPSVTFAEEKVLIFLILHEKC